MKTDSVARFDVNKLGNKNYSRIWRKRNTEKEREYSKKRRFMIKAFYPWLKAYHAAKSRCENPSCYGYYRYGGRGIKMLMSQDDFKFLWFRDNAGDMKQASIDRIDVDKDYSIDNCRYIELDENRHRMQKTHCIKGHPFDSENTKIIKGGYRKCKQCLIIYKNRKLAKEKRRRASLRKTRLFTKALAEGSAK